MCGEMINYKKIKKKKKKMKMRNKKILHIIVVLFFLVVVSDGRFNIVRHARKFQQLAQRGRGGKRSTGGGGDGCGGERGGEKAAAIG